MKNFPSYNPPPLSAVSTDGHAHAYSPWYVVVTPKGMITHCLLRTVSLIFPLTTLTDTLSISLPEGRGSEPQHQHTNKLTAQQQPQQLWWRTNKPLSGLTCQKENATFRHELVGFRLSLD